MVSTCLQTNLPAPALTPSARGQAMAHPVSKVSAELPLGLVVFKTPRGEPAAAILDATGTWHCPKLPVLNRVLNILFNPARGVGGDEPFGHAELRRVAAWIKGEVRSLRPAD